MNAWINYFIEANIALMIVLLFYRIFLYHSTDFTFNRFFLLGSLFISLIFPLIEIGNDNSNMLSISRAVPVYWLPEVVIGNTHRIDPEASATTLHTWQIISWVYFVGIVLLLLRFVYQVVKIYRLADTALTSYRSENIRIYETNFPIPSFSFFRFILISNSVPLTEEDKKQVIRHETIHIKKLHAADIVLAELISIVFWFNPLVRVFKKILSDIHEFQADERSVEDQNVQSYCRLLARITLESAGFSLANHFNQSFTLKRINMMKSIKKKTSKWAIAAIVPLMAGLFFLISCQDQVMSELDAVVKNSSMASNVPADIQAKYEALQKAHPEFKYIVMELNPEGKARLDEMEKQYGLPKSIQVFTVGEKNYEATGNPSITAESEAGIQIRQNDQIDDSRRTFAIIEYNNQTEAIADQTATHDDVFTIVEETAQPKGGMDEFYKYIASNSKYPEEAKKKGISGRVFVEFIVEKDGTLSNLKVLKGIGYGCDEEAVRVLSSAPAWMPARQRGEAVRQKMVLPMVFNSDVSTGPATPVNKKMNLEIERIGQVNGIQTIRGYVKDEDNLPMAGVNIVISGSTTGTVTDNNGRFEISLTKKQKLVFSHVGFETRTMVLPN